MSKDRAGKVRTWLKIGLILALFGSVMALLSPQIAIIPLPQNVPIEAVGQLF